MEDAQVVVCGPSDKWRVGQCLVPQAVDGKDGSTVADLVAEAELLELGVCANESLRFIFAFHTVMCETSTTSNSPSIDMDTKLEPMACCIIPDGPQCIAPG